MRPASRFKRILANIIDSILVSIPATALMVILIFLCFITDNTEHLATLSFKFFSFFVILAASLYFALFESSKYQASPGKKLLNLYVCNTDNQKLSFMRALSRYLLLTVSGGLPMCFLQLTSNTMTDYISKVESYNWLLLIGFLWGIACLMPVFFTKDRRTLYDMLSSSRVCSRKLPDDAYVASASTL